MRSLRRILPWTVVLLVASAAGAEIPVGGRVVAPGGAPVRGAEVGLEPFPPGYERVDMRLGGRVAPDPVTTTISDAEGFFELAAPGPGMWKVTVAAPGHLTMERLLRPLYEAVELPAVELEPTVAFEVRTADPQGRPRDARVAMSTRHQGRVDWRPRLRMGRSGDDGTIRFVRGRDENVRLEVLAAGSPLLFFERDAGPGSIAVELPPGVAGTVRVGDAAGRPVAGALAFQGGGLLPLGKTDAEGRLDLVLAEHEPRAVSFLTADGHANYVDLRFPAGEGSADAGETGAVEVRLEPPRLVRGQVVDAESREPVPEALVWTDRGELAEADRRGIYEIRMRSLRRAFFNAVAEGYGVARAEHRFGEESPESGLSLALPPAAAVSGEVVDEDGLPVAGVEILALPTTPGGRRLAYRPRPFRSSRCGSFHVSGLRAGGSYELIFRKPGFAPARRRLDAVTAFETRSDLRIVLESGRAAVGRVVDEDASPVAGAEVRLAPPRETATPYSYYFRRAEEVAAATATSDAEGRFRIPDVAPGRYDLEVAAAGFAPAGVPGLQVGERPREVDLGTVVLAPEAQIEGRVRNADGEPVAGAEICTRPRARRSFGSFDQRAEPAAVSDASGRFTVSGLRPGEQHQLLVAKAGYGAEIVSAVAARDAGETVEVVLRAAARLAGRVVEPDGDPVPGAQVTAGSFRSAAQLPPSSSRTDADGRFALDVRAGTVTVVVSARSYQKFTLAGVEAPAGGEVSGLEIVLQRGATIEGTVTDAAGRPVVEARVQLSAPPASGARPLGYATTDGEGRYRILGAPPGPATLTVRAGQWNHQQAAKTVAVRAGTQTVDVVLEAGFEVSGRLFDAAGDPVAGAVLTLEGTEPARRYLHSGGATATSAADGTFTMTDVDPGSYHLRAYKEGFAEGRTEEPFEVVDGPVSGLELELRRGATLHGRILGLELDDLPALEIRASSDRGSTAAGRVDFEARYTAPNLGPGNWWVRARIPAGGRQAAGQVKVEDGDTDVVLDLEFTAGYNLSGVVLRAGDPVAGVWVRAYSMASRTGASSTSRTGHDGRFRFEQRPAGKHNLIVQPPDSLFHHAREVDLVADQEVTIEIADSRISGHVRDQGGERPVPEANVTLERLDPENSAAPQTFGYGSANRTDSRGYFSFHAPEGVWRLVAVKAGYAPAEVTVDLRGGVSRDDLELRLAPAAGGRTGEARDDE